LSEAEEQLPKTYWVVSERDGQDGRKDIYFGVITPGCPPEQLALKNEIDRTLDALKLIYRTDDRNFTEYFEKLLGLAQVGLVGANPAINVATSALEGLKAEIVNREGGRVKNGYMYKLGRWALGFLIVFVVLYLVACSRFVSVAPVFFVYRDIFLVWAGSMAGAWASFASRKVVLGFFDLAVVEDDRVEPPLRLVFTIVMTGFLSLIFITGMTNVIFGTLKASDILHSGPTALLMGGFAGLAEKTLPATVMQNVQSFIGKSKV